MRDWELDKKWLWLWVVVVVLTGIVVLGGCASNRGLGIDAVEQAKCRSEIASCAMAIQAGDLAQARTHLEAAKLGATNFTLGRQVRSLERLIAGAEALEAGDIESARQQWSQIQDPRLAREVRIKAQRIGVDVPLTAVALAEENQQ